MPIGTASPRAQISVILKIAATGRYPAAIFHSQLEDISLAALQWQPSKQNALDSLVSVVLFDDTAGTAAGGCAPEISHDCSS